MILCHYISPPIECRSGKTGLFYILYTKLCCVRISQLLDKQKIRSIVESVARVAPVRRGMIKIIDEALKNNFKSRWLRRRMEIRFDRCKTVCYLKNDLADLLKF